MSIFKVEITSIEGQNRNVNDARVYIRDLMLWYTLWIQVIHWVFGFLNVQIFYYCYSSAFLNELFLAGLVLYLLE